MKNVEAAELLQAIADLLEIEGENPYKVRAYRRAAEEILLSPHDLAELHRQGRLREIPQVGEAIARKLGEWLDTGKLSFYEQLVARTPLSLREILKVPGLGPKLTGELYRRLGITNIEDLRRAVAAGRLRGFPGIGPHKEAAIRSYLGMAPAIADATAAYEAEPPPAPPRSETPSS
ncbi:MAG TPA: hypothetical protein GXX55_05655 [Firmicutes bacterium]|nr:hypothetical protein [Bacillota bacterium]